MLDQYLESKKNAWSAQTLKTAGSVLKKFDHLIHGKATAEQAFAVLEGAGIAKYTQITYAMYFSGYWKWLHKEEAPYQAYLKDNRQVFKNAYTRKTVSKTFDEVYSALTSLPESLEREACLRMLLSAQRASEAGLYRKESERDENINKETILGKGSKIRANYSPIATHPVSYYHVYRFLRSTLGITPHALRKLATTRAGDNGASPQDLCEIAGWSDIRTAYYYLQPKNTERLKGLMK